MACRLACETQVDRRTPRAVRVEFGDRPSRAGGTGVGDPDVGSVGSHGYGSHADRDTLNEDAARAEFTD